MIENRTRDSLYKLGDIAMKHYSKMENRFSNKSLLPKDIPSEGRRRLLEVLLNELRNNISLVNTDNGYSLDFDVKLHGILTLTTHDFTAGKLRGNVKDLPVSRWSPIVLDAVMQKHNISYEDFWLKGNPLARVMLGNDLKDLTIPVKRKVLDKLSPNSSYIIDGEGNKVTRNHDVDYNDKSLRILRFKSTLYSVVYDEYPKNYEPGLSKELMRGIIDEVV